MVKKCPHCGDRDAGAGGFCSQSCHGAFVRVGYEREADIEARYQAALRVIRHERSKGAYDETLDRYVHARKTDPCSEVA